MSNDIKLRIAVEGAEASAKAVDNLQRSLSDLSKNAELPTRPGESWRRLAADFAHVGQSILIAKEAFSGITGAVGGTVSALVAAQQAADKLANSLGYSSGVANVAREMDYLRTTARNLGLDYQSAAEGYSKFSTAVKGSGMTLAQTREVFEGVAQATARFGLSAADTQGAFLALSQMASKGVVSAEEFRQQLAERLPGATQIAARALGVTTAEFNKLLESGNLIASDFLPKFGAALKNEITAPVNSLTQEINRLTGAWEQWKQALANADGGGFQWLTNGLNESAAAMRSLGKEAGVVQKLLMAIGGFEAGAIGAGKFDTAKVQEQAMAKLGGIISQRRALEGQGSRTAFESEALRGLIREEQALRDQLMQLAERRGKETAVLPDIAQEYKDQQSKRRTAFDAYMKDVQGEKQKQIAAEIERFSALTAVIGSSGKDYEAAYAAHQAKLAELRKGKSTGAGAAKNDAAETFAARLKEEQDYAKTAVEIIQEKVKQQVLSEREGIEQTLAAQQAGMVAQAKLLKAQLAGTTDGGQREKIKAQIVALGNDAAVAAEKAASGFAKIDQAATAAGQKILAGMADETNALLLKAKAAEEENATIGLSADRLAELTRQRYDERIAILQAKAAAMEGNTEREAERYLIEQQIGALQRLRDAEITKPRLREQSREWEKFADDINRSLTDALFRAFESGNGFGKSFVDTLGNTIKTALAKALIQATITTGSNALNTGINAVFGTSGANGGAGTNYLGLANNASSIYNLYSGGQAAYTAYTGTGALTSSEAGAAAWQYLQGGDWGTALGVYLKGLTGAAPTAASTTAATTTTASSSMGMSTALGYMAVIALAFQALTNSKTRYLDTNITGTLGPDGLTNGMIGDRYKYTGNLLDAGGTYLEWRPLTGNEAELNEFYTNMRYGIYRNLEALQYVGYLGPSFDPYTLQNVTYTQEQIEAAFAKYVADNDALDIRINRTASGETVATELQQGLAIKLAFEAIYKGAKSSLEATAKLFGDDSLGKALEGYVSQINIKTSGSITEAIGKYADELISGMGAAWLPTVESLRQTTEQNGKKITETWSQAFSRLAVQAQSVSDVFDLLGESLANLYGKNTDRIISASDAFVKLFGSVDAMNSAISGYYDNFYSSAEKSARAWDVIGKQFDAIGVSTPKTRDEFRRLVEAQDLTTISGRQAFKALIDLQGAFAGLVPVIEQTADNLRGDTDAAYQALERAVSKQRESYELALEVAEAQADGIRTLLGIITSAVDDLQQDAAGRSAQGRQFIADALSAAQTSGYLPDPDQLSKAIADARYGMDGTVYASETDRQRDRLILAGQLSKLGDVGKKQMTVAEQQVAAAKASIKSLDDLLDSYQDQIDAIRDVNGGVKSVEQAIKDMQAALTKEIQTATQILVSSLLANLQAGLVRPTEVKKELEKKGVTLKPDEWNKVQTPSGLADVYQSSGGAIGYKETLYGTNGTNVTFADAISNVNAALGAGNPMLVYTSARDMGVSANSLDALMGWAPGTSNAWADDNKLPRFAKGGYYAGGMALVGEEGPEIINFRSPGQVYNASQTRDALGVKALEERVETLIGLMIEGNRNSRRTADAVNGAPEAPILVTTV